MTHALVTIISKIDANAVGPLAELISKLGNPARDDVRAKLDVRDGDSGTHFASLHALPSGHGDHGYLVLEFSADGSEEEALARLVNAIGAELEEIFKQSLDWDGAEKLLPYLQHRIVRIGHGYFNTPGVTFTGTPGMSVGRIWKECKLAARSAQILAEQPPYMRPIDRLGDVRDKLRKDTDNDYRWALEPPAAPPLEPPPSSIISLVLQAIPSFFATYLWPFAVGVLLVALWVGIRAWSLSEGFSALVMTAIGAVIVILLIALGLYLLLRYAEKRDWVDERAADRATLEEILSRENHYAQNHMVSVTRRKPGLVRWLAIRVVFWIVTQFVARLYRPGFLGDIGSIHFARWVTVPGTHDFLFFSNYGGSWESYLEDFITRAHFGLTGVWSNSVGFPRASNLIEGGASDGERFKRYARRSMLPTPFWYNAYPAITTSHIRLNASIRRGLAGAFSNDEAKRWLALFGSAQKPDSTLESNEIQSLVFGGLGFMPYGCCILLELGDRPDEAQKWLGPLLPDIAFGDGRRFKSETQADAVILAALGPGALSKLGLPEECVKGFPAPFLNGMASPSRARVLGDVGDNAADNWWWGKSPPDVALLVYGPSAEAVAILEEKINKLAKDHKQKILRKIDLKEITQDKTEPFGFVDGISQPTIRGTYKGMRLADEIHMVEPGEFVLGYPDNRGNTPPGPVLSPLHDPHNRLPILVPNDDFATNSVNAPRDIGRNGSFLVIRQLEQNTDDFSQYCANEAKRLAHRIGPPYIVSPDLIAAKMIGRWKDGSSLVRHPYMSGSDEMYLRMQSTTLARAKTDPANSTPIQPPARPSPKADNDFLFGDEDPEALRCPFGAHIRRANPRDSFDPGSKEQIDISNRHRLLRVGRFYEPEAGKNRGLLFMCLNADIDRQFEFVQQTWLASSSFHGLVGEQDPVIGGGRTDATGFMIPTRDGPVRLNPLPRFITTRGGGYFFLPGKRLLYFLAGDT